MKIPYRSVAPRGVSDGFATLNAAADSNYKIRANTNLQMTYNAPQGFLALQKMV
jgi:hypothetical protein